MTGICFLQRYVQSHLWSCAISAEWRLKHCMNISWYNSIPVLKNVIHNTAFCSVANQKPVYFSEVWWINVISGRQIYVKFFFFFFFFELFEVWVLNFSLKDETMSNKHNQNAAQLAHYMIVFYAQGSHYWLWIESLKTVLCE